MMVNDFAPLFSENKRKIIDELLQGATSADADKRFEAIAGLWRYYSPDVEVVLLKAASDPDPIIRFEAVATLEDHYSPDIEAVLLKAASDPDPNVAGRATEALAARGHPKARDLILDHLRSDSAQLLRQMALRSAGIVDISPHLEQAWLALERRHWVERTAGASALAKAGELAALPRIRELAQRARSLRQLPAESQLLGSAALLGDMEAAIMFLSRLSSINRDSRDSAALFLGRPGKVESLARVTGPSRLRCALLVSQQLNEARRRELAAITGHPIKGGWSPKLYDDLLRRVGSAEG
jgi:HEAT repeat protein